MQYRTLLFVSLISVIGLQSAYGFGCPHLPVVKDFNVNAFMGTWYQQASKGTFWFQGPGSCAKAEYALVDTGSVSVHNSQKGLFGEQNVEGTAVLSDPKSGEGTLKVTLHTPVGQQTADLSVLATDYNNFAILCSCKTVIIPFKSCWILTRKQKLEGDDKTDVDKKIDAAFDHINQNKDTPKRSAFSVTSQNNC
ncbi:apolipoprotein D-like [Macrosteles quadrilineatus]|uniref:apolipoprotein D-like n=1 Tax=Macrosteles quadrilineatus TaxID=74068 RepID=UPI0023E21E7C|nr:apolipoprotein D-like [Macrosteles quadrilineatus]XP_054258437.1 apolipoprotein D-like [Macrosteles quadrilineatus]